jgi:hypothetical protein
VAAVRQDELKSFNDINVRFHFATEIAVTDLIGCVYPPELSEIDEDFLARESALATLDPPDFHASE